MSYERGLTCGRGLALVGLVLMAMAFGYSLGVQAGVASSEPQVRTPVDAEPPTAGDAVNVEIAERG